MSLRVRSLHEGVHYALKKFFMHSCVAPLRQKPCVHHSFDARSFNVKTDRLTALKAQFLWPVIGCVCFPPLHNPLLPLSPIHLSFLRALLHKTLNPRETFFYFSSLPPSLLLAIPSAIICGVLLMLSFHLVPFSATWFV